jgi:hypothetical protein
MTAIAERCSIEVVQSRVWLVVALAGLAVGCGSGGKTTPPGGGDGTGGRGGVQDAGAVDSCANQTVTSVPAGWVRPANCSGVGNLCSSGCGSAGGRRERNVCIPFQDVGGSANACTPYCAAFACMSFDDASCFCTGEAAAQNPACACGPAALAGLCAAEGGSCANTPCCDCLGLRCVTDSVSGTVCRQPCSSDADCATGCCDTGAGTCHDALYCNCVGTGQTCGSGGPDCCPGTSCLTFSSDGSGPFSCYANCNTQADCATGCCSLPIQGQTYGACGPCQ